MFFFFFSVLYIRLRSQSDCNFRQTESNNGCFNVGESAYFVHNVGYVVQYQLQVIYILELPMVECSP